MLYPAAFGNGLVLTPHTYLLDGATVLTGDLTLNAQNNVNAVFVIKINGALSTSTYASVILLNGAQAKNVFWKVDGGVNLNEYADFKGTIVANNGAVALNTGVTLSGRALTTNGELATFAINAQMTPGCLNTVGTSPNLTAVSIGRITATACIGTSINPVVRVRNIGTEDVSTYNVRFRVVSPSGTNITNVTRNRTPFGVGVLDSIALGTSVVLNQVGTYTVSAIVMAAGDTIPANDSTGVRITVIQVPTPIVTGDDAFCFGGNTTLTSSVVTGNLWSNGATSRSITVSSAGNYSVRNIANGCTSAVSNVVAVSVTALPSIPTVSGDDAFCFGGNTTLTSSVVIGNLWSNGSTSRSITVSSAGNYSVRNIANGCTSAVSNVMAVGVSTVPSAVEITAGGPTSICFETSVVLTAPTGLTSYRWLNGTNVIPGQIDNTFLASANGVYSVQIGNDLCFSPPSNAITVVVDPAIAAPAITNSDPSAICEGYSTTLTASGAASNATYIWSTGETTPSIVVRTAIANITVRSVVIGQCTSAASTAISTTILHVDERPIINTNGNILTASGTFSNGTVFEWLKDGRVIFDNNTDTLDISADANTGVHRYQVRSVRNNACKSDTSVSSVINGINSAVNRSSELKAFPIPTSNTLHISLPNVNGTKVVVRLVDNFGKEVYIHEVSVAGSLAADINVNHLPVGMYQLLVNGDKLGVSKTIVKK